MPGGGPVPELDALAGYFWRVIEQVDDLRAEVEQTKERDDRVLAYLRASGREAGNGSRVELHVMTIFHFRERRCVKVEGFLDEQAALAAWQSLP